MAGGEDTVDARGGVSNGEPARARVQTIVAQSGAPIGMGLPIALAGFHLDGYVQRGRKGSYCGLIPDLSPYHEGARRSLPLPRGRQTRRRCPSWLRVTWA